MVIRAIHSDVLGDIVGERLHEGLEIFLATYFADVFSREVAVHAGSIPVTLDGFAMQNYIHCVFLTETHHQIASGPGVIRGFGGAFGEDLEFPLPFCDFRVDAFMIDARGMTELQMFVDDLAGQAAHVFVAYAAVVRALGSCRMAVFGEAERASVFKEEVFLFETNPQVRVILDGSAHVRRMRGSICVENLIHDNIGVLAAGIRVQSHWLENAVRTVPFSLHSGTAVKAPFRQIRQGGWLLK